MEKEEVILFGRLPFRQPQKEDKRNCQMRLSHLLLSFTTFPFEKVSGKISTLVGRGAKKNLFAVNSK